MSYTPARRLATTVSVVEPFYTDVALGLLEPASHHHIQAYDAVSVTVCTFAGGLTPASVKGGSYCAYLVKGSPFITTRYTKATPKISGGNKANPSAHTTHHTHIRVEQRTWTPATTTNKASNGPLPAPRPAVHLHADEP